MSKKALDSYDARVEPQPEVPTGQMQRKKTKRWCRGKVGREHVTEIVMNPATSYLFPIGTARSRCHESTWMPTRWSCGHIERCVNCGKHVRWTLPRDECPVWRASCRTS